MDSQEAGVTGEVRVKDIKDGLIALLILSLNSSLEDADQVGDEALNGLEGLRVLLGLNVHEDGTNGLDNVDADLLAVRVLDAGLEQLKKLVGVFFEMLGVLLQHGEENEGADFSVQDIVAVVEGQDLLHEVFTLAILHVNTNETSDEAGKSMARSRRALLQSAFQQVRASQRLLVLSSLFPVLGSESKGLNGGKLSDCTVIVGKGNLDEQDERVRLGVVVLLKIGSDSLDLFRVGYIICQAIRVSTGS